ncbi:MAG: hypothetical protein NTY07_16255 [Bacteroidia bacterium]|nr:hypothetical protein [Bacteroidia bacterium]
MNNPLNLNLKYDLIWSFEVIEHIHSRLKNNFIQTLLNHSNILIISAAAPGQGGEGHFNEQPLEYWITKFEQLGFKNNVEFVTLLRNTNEKHAENIMVFEKIENSR